MLDQLDLILGRMSVVVPTKMVYNTWESFFFSQVYQTIQIKWAKNEFRYRNIRLFN